MKFIHKDNFSNYIIGLISLIISTIALPNLPDQIPVHFNAQGIEDGYGSPWTIFIFPVIILLVTIFAEITKHADPKSGNYSVFTKHYYLFFLVFDIFMMMLQLYMITYAMGIVTFNISNIIIISVGVLFIIIGNLLPKIKQNYFMGIKTPWAIADEQVWYTTHRFAGKLWFIAGIIMCICGFLPSSAFLPCILICIIIAAIVPMVYSYLIYKRRSLK